MRPLCQSTSCLYFKESNVSCRIMGCGSLAMLPCAHMYYLSGSEGWDCFTATTAQSHCGCIIAKLLLHLAVKCNNIPASVYQHTPSSVQLLSCVRLRPHRLQHARTPCLSPTPRVYSNSRPLSRWCHSTILSSVVPFSSCPQSVPASGSFKSVSSSYQVAKVLEFQLQHQSFQWIFRVDFL